VDDARLAVDLDGLDDVDDADVGQLAGELRALVAPPRLQSLALAPLQQHPHARGDLFDVDGLAEVVLHAQLQPTDLFFDRLVAGEEDERDLRPLGSLLDPAAEVEPVHLVHVRVRDDEIGRALLHRGQRLDPVVRGGDDEARFLEADVEDAQALGIAVDEEEALLTDSGLHGRPQGRWWKVWILYCCPAVCRNDPSRAA
jgi:hypothetical protein